MHIPEPVRRPPSFSLARLQAEALTYTVNDASRACGLSRSTLYRHAAAGRLRLLRVGGRTLVDASSLRTLLGVMA